MPNIQIQLQSGYDETKMSRLIRKIPEVVCRDLENTRPNMVFVTLNETRNDLVFDGGIEPETITPTLSFILGPGRSEEAVHRCLTDLTELFEQYEICPRENVRIYIMDPQPQHLSIGGEIRW